MKWVGWKLADQVRELGRRADLCEAVGNRTAAANLREWGERLSGNDQLDRKSGFGS